MEDLESLREVIERLGRLELPNDEERHDIVQTVSETDEKAVKTAVGG